VIGEFSAQDAIRPPYNVALKGRAVRIFVASAIALGIVGVAVLGFALSDVQRSPDRAYPLLWLGALVLIAGVAALNTALIVQFNATVGRLLKRYAFLVFLGGVAALVLIPWGCALLYSYVESLQPAGGAYLALSAMRSHLAQDGGMPLAAMAYPLWPLQFQIVRDVISLAGAVGFVSIVASFGIWWERKVAGRIQSRLGPMRVGGWHGWAQSMADGLKLIQKEDLVLDFADKPLFRLAPFLTFVPALSAFIALPFSAAWVFRDLDVGLIFILAMFGIGVVGVLLGGWASNNKWSVYGAMREACQMVSYEVPMGMALLVPVMLAGTLRLTQIGDMQSGGFHTWLAFSNPFAFVAAVIYVVASLAACKRAPFDLPEAESELVAGYHTEYSGFRWSLFFFGEYAEMFAVAALATILFFGAWHSPLPSHWGEAWKTGPLWQRGLHGLLFSGPAWLIAKGFFFFYVQIWLRWTLPRIRLDQVMYACVQVLLPLTMLVLLGNTLWGLFVPKGSLIAYAFNAVFTLIGAVLVIGFIAIGLYGFANRRRLVGTQVVDHLPGA
jgi:NADH-quinone oxidoreductase subunit H